MKYAIRYLTTREMLDSTVIPEELVKLQFWRRFMELQDAVKSKRWGVVEVMITIETEEESL